jgi:aspartate/methionine/tyrosine aminotransferase
MADFSSLSRSEEPDAFVRRLTAESRVGAIPPESFYLHPRHARGLVRFAFCKQLDTLEKAMRQLSLGT